ncbi:group II truncated hemoglobin [Paracoccus sp. PS-1]|uniref:group II truncated hemoglobin n=1 Tax=unclassified Paracoccus (in: a-proteobacteria) TaxID=2688777 RepID=UPI00048F903E|nr:MULTISPECIES: group II truncated hemoglobin [unclassified Paracoccus (in: a-proteobacteria)]MDQ7264038.1 group II truncated hemoglobin [Paracoccus sp. PS1]
MYFAAQRKQSIYQQLGGDEGIRALVKEFYDIVEQDEDARELHLLHLQGAGVAHSREEQFNYLSGFFGGPQYYVMKHRHARLKEIHAHVPIGPQMRDLWLRCMAKAIDRRGIDGELAAVLMRHFTTAAESSRNMD